MEAPSRRRETFDLDREVRQSLFLLGLTAAVSGASLGLALLAQVVMAGEDPVPPTVEETRPQIWALG